MKNNFFRSDQGKCFAFSKHHGWQFITIQKGVSLTIQRDQPVYPDLFQSSDIPVHRWMDILNLRPISGAVIRLFDCNKVMIEVSLIVEGFIIHSNGIL